MLLLVVMFGNVFGLVVNWLLGCYIEYFCYKCWFLVLEDKLQCV